MNKYIIRPIPLCKGVRNKSQLTYRHGLGDKIEICCYVWYIEGTEPKVVIDTGTSADWYHAHGVPQQEHIQNIDEGFGRFGVKPEDIDIVILTHLHADHIEQAKKFSHAKLFVQKDELEAIKHPATASEYVDSLFDGLNFTSIEGDERIMDGISVILTPGHTPGTQSIAVETAGGLAVISGFCSVDDNFGDEKRDLPIFAPGVFTNILDAYDSIVKVKQIADIVISLHDMKYTHVESIP